MHLSDFSDKLPPMLVKELRQGLRTRTFVGVFLTLQIFLVIVLLAAGSSSGNDNVGEIISNVIFFLIAVALLILQPLRGINAISSEIKDNTIDMMVLTRLSARRIIFGKWTAIVSQSALLLITIIPYLILRYFFGGMNLVGELMLMLMLFATSATITAITIALSASGSIILRTIVPIIGLPIIGLFSLIGLIFGQGVTDISNAFGFQSQEGTIGLAIFIGTLIYYAYYAISAGTMLIAPHAESSSIARRVVALITTVATVILCYFFLKEEDMIPLFLLIVLLPIFTLSFSEYAELLAPVQAKFTQYGFLGKIASTFFSPGWASGLFFCLILTAISSVLFLAKADFGMDKDVIIVSLSLLGSMIFPVLILNLFRVTGKARLAVYILAIVAMTLSTTLIAGMAEALSADTLLLFFCWIPAIGFGLMDSNFSDENVIYMLTCFNAVYILALLVMAIRYRRNLMQSMHTEQLPDQTV